MRGRERRQHARLDLDGWPIALDLSDGRAVRICDLSRGGFQTESVGPARLGDTHTFRIRLADADESVIIRATAAHMRPTPGRPTFLIGWQASDDPISEESLVELIQHLTTLESYRSPHRFAGFPNVTPMTKAKR
jgi:hypothetical protein